MPMAGIGTFLLTPDQAESAVLEALKDGYKLIDTANAYVNEKAVGRAIKKSGLAREDVFLESKIWPSFYEQEDAVEKTLERLDTDYIDLLLIHQPSGNYVAGYRLLEKAYKEGKVKALIVTGCMAERYKDEILEEIPEVDEVLGTTAYDKILDAVDAALEGNQEVILSDIDALPLPETKRLVTTGGHFAYLKIAEGCNKCCTYCIIPKLRGRYRSVPMERLIEQAKELAAQGVKELILVAQETTVYGVDLYGKKSLHLLLEQLCRISGLRWIRILYCYPEEIYEDLIQTMKREEKICHYLDLPIQHASDAVLRRMGRRTTRADLEQIVTHLREEIPDIVLRTTLIAGFPGETEEQHQEVMEFIDEMEFDRLGVFTYSQEEDTPAASMPDQIDEETKLNWQEELMELQQEIAFDRAEERTGSVVTAMIEGKVADEDAYVARTYGDAPNVDGLLFVQTTEELNSGDFVRVRITGAVEYDLIGELTEDI